MRRVTLNEILTRNFHHIDHILDDNEYCIHDPFSEMDRAFYLLDTNGVHDDLCTVSLTQGLAEALELPSNVSLNDVLAHFQQPTMGL
jgi:hypothetical protein